MIRSLALCLILLGSAWAGEESPPLTLDVPIAETLAPSTQRTFSLSVETERLYRIEVSGAEGLVVEVLDQDRRRILRDGSLGSRRALRLLVDGRDGPQWVRVIAAGDGRAAFRLSWSVYAPGPDDHGDGPGQATGLRWELAQAGRLERPADDDWFAFDLEPAEDIQVELRAGAGGGPLRLERFDASGERLRDAVTVAPGGSRRIFLRSLRGGAQRLRVSGDSDDVDHGYALTWGPARDDHGDGPAGATPVEVGERVEGDLETFADQDVFRVQLLAGRTYRVVYGGVFSVELRDPSGRRRHRGFYGLVRAFTPRREGSWTLHVPADYPGHYSLRVLELEGSRR